MLNKVWHASASTLQITGKRNAIRRLGYEVATLLLCLLPRAALAGISSQVLPLQGAALQWATAHDLAWLYLTTAFCVLMACSTALSTIYLVWLNRKLRDQLNKTQVRKEQLADQAVRDPLTGLFNRRYLDEVLERELARAMSSQRPLSLLMIDIDHFKNINDTFGHPVGDCMLYKLGVLLENRIRSSDIACRYGGEEFIVVMPEAAGHETLQRAEQLRIAFASLIVEAGENNVSATLSIGLASYSPDHTCNATALVRDADKALYRAKNNGRNRVMVFRPEEAISANMVMK